MAHKIGGCTAISHGPWEQKGNCYGLLESDVLSREYKKSRSFYFLQHFPILEDGVEGGIYDRWKTMFQFPMRKRPFHRKNGQKKRETCGIDRNHQHGKKNGKKKTNLGYRVTWNEERRRVGGRLAATSRGLGRRSRAVPAAEPIGPASRRPAHEGSTVQSPSWAATGWTPARKRSGKKKMCIV